LEDLCVSRQAVYRRNQAVPEAKNHRSETIDLVKAGPHVRSARLREREPEGRWPLRDND
jgi:hypothetical protein